MAIVFIPEIPGTRASGAARWLTSAKALIQLSLRYRSDDHLWFSLFHEAGHVLQHGKKETFVHEDAKGGGRPADELEREADAFAATTLIPKQFDSELPLLQSAGAIERFATQLGIAPGIVVGRMQHDGLVGWNHHNQLKQRFRWTESEAG